MPLKPGQTSKGVLEKSEKLAKGMDNRIEHLQRLLSHHQSNKSFPVDSFIPNPTKLALREWDDPDSGIYKMSVNTFSKDPYKVKLLVELSTRVKDIHEKNQNPVKKNQSQKKETISHWKKKYKNEKYKTQKLTDELIGIRTLYIDLLEELDAHKQLSKRTQEAVKRHRKLYGTMTIANLTDNDDQ